MIVTPSKPRLRLCLTDMNNGHPNQAMRCFSLLIDRFFASVKKANPTLETELVVVEPRNKLELPSKDCDLHLSSGGPGGPYDHDQDAWLTDWKLFVDDIVDRTIQKGPGAPAMFGVCYTYELFIRHFAVSAMEPRARRKFGVMPVYMTEDGMKHETTAPFGDRLFAFEHRNWEAIDLDEKKLRQLGGKLLAQESRDGVSKGKGLLAFDFAPGVEGTQFHPEADKGGVVAWVSKREQAQAFIEAYGHETYTRMLKTLDNPQRLAKTFTTMIPGWLVRKFNVLAEVRDWKKIELPSLDIDMFQGDSPPAASVADPSLLPGAIQPNGGAASASRIKAAAMDFDDANAPIAPEFTLRPLEETLDPAVADEGQSL